MLVQVSIAVAAFMTSIAPSAKASPLPSSSPNTYIQLNKRSSDGRGTVYFQEGAVGSCGQANPDGAMIVAISPSHGNMCGRKLKVSNMGSNDGVPTSGQSVVVTVADTCPSCGPNDLDLSVGAWNALTNGAAPATFFATWEVV